MFGEDVVVRILAGVDSGGSGTFPHDPSRASHWVWKVTHSRKYPSVSLRGLVHLLPHSQSLSRKLWLKEILPSQNFFLLVKSVSLQLSNSLVSCPLGAQDQAVC